MQRFEGVNAHLFWQRESDLIAVIEQNNLYIGISLLQFADQG